MAFASTVAQCLAGDDHRIVACDDAFLEILGRPRGEVLGCHPLELTHQADRQLNATMLRRLQARGRSFSITKRYLRADGSLVWVTNTVAPVGDGIGRTGICATSTVIDRPINPSVIARNLAMARRLCAAFVTGKRLIGPSLLTSPAAEVLLALYVAEAEGRSSTGAQLAAMLQLSSDTSLRWLEVLHARGLIEVERGEQPTMAASYRIARSYELVLDGILGAIGAPQVP